jgi:sarcosine oxidase subunit alpha
VRNNVGMLDGSTLGKFRIHGPDALKALQRVYVSDMSKVKEGRIKYSAMCNDDGCVIDDGVVVKLGENDYYFTTSTGRAGQTVEWIRYHTRFDGWDFTWST